MNNVPDERLVPLPILVRPRSGETTGSYIRRLARANHLRPSYLHGFLAGPPTWFGRPRLERLAVYPDAPLRCCQRRSPTPAPLPVSEKPEKELPSLMPLPTKERRARISAWEAPLVEVAVVVTSTTPPGEHAQQRSALLWRSDSAVADNRAEHACAGADLFGGRALAGRPRI
jgi:hypothetical protein